MLYSFVLAAKRALRSIYVPAMLAVMAIAVFFAPMLGHEEELPPAGICDLDNTEYSKKVCEYLLLNGFVTVESEAELREMVSKSELDCGAILNAGFGERLTDADLEEAVVFIDSPLSYQPELYRNHIGAAILGEVAPYISVKYLKDTDITADMVVEEYRKMVNEGSNFSFALQTADSVEITDSGHAKTYVLGAASLLIFAFMMYAACDVYADGVGELAHRIGMKKTVLYTVIPDLSVRVCGVWLAMLAAAVMSKLIMGDGVLLSLVIPLFVYTLLLGAFGVLLGVVLANTGRIQIFTFFVLVMSLVLCPIYIDLSLMVPWLERFRYILPPYWLWLSDGSIVMPMIAVASVPASLGAMYLRFARKPNK